MLELCLDELREVHRRIAPLVRPTPILELPALAGQIGGEIRLKAENLQETGSFKLRGAVAKLEAEGRDVAGVVSGSAGNHGLALAYAADRLGIACRIHMPASAPVSKVDSIDRLGATIVRERTAVDECIERARRVAEETGQVFVHPFDDADVIRGNAGVGIEIAEDLRELGLVLVPVGGGGLASGVAAAVKPAHPGCRVIGVQAEACAPFAEPSAARGSDAIWTIADGIAVKDPRGITPPLLERWVDEVVTVGEDAIAEGIVHLAEHAKLVAEGAGAVGVAALLAGVVQPAQRGVTAIVVSGGNIDPSVLAGVINRHESLVGRRVRIVARVPDHPGGLAELLGMIAAADVNVLEVVHVRDATELAVGETDVELLLETRGRDHSEQIQGRLHAEGYLRTY